MSDRRRDEVHDDVGATTATGGTPMAVAIEADVSSRRGLALLFAGPTIWFAHFGLVYLVAEMGCNGGGPGFENFAPPVPAVVGAVATLLAVAGCAALARAEWVRWRTGPDTADRAGRGTEEGVVDDMGPDEPGSPLDFVGFLCAVVSLVAVVFTAVPLLVLSC